VTSVLREDLGQDLAMMARLVQSQLIRGMTAFFQRDAPLAEQVTQKDDQVDNLLGLIEVKCFERIAGEEPNGVRSRQLRGVFRVALNLEKLGDYAVNIAEQAVHVSRLKARPIPFDLAGPARVALAALDEVITAFTDANADKAKHACRCELACDAPSDDAGADDTDLTVFHSGARAGSRAAVGCSRPLPSALQTLRAPPRMRTTSSRSHCRRTPWRRAGCSGSSSH